MGHCCSSQENTSVDRLYLVAQLSKEVDLSAIDLARFMRALSDSPDTNLGVVRAMKAEGIQCDKQTVL
jgi:hypothetical protein